MEGQTVEAAVNKPVWRPERWHTGRDLGEALGQFVGHKVSINTHNGDTYSAVVVEVIWMLSGNNPILLLDADVNRPGHWGLEVGMVRVLVDLGDGS